ncbi:MAG TPA: tetratricopeptide repeat protein [Paenirhodobacter sp.]
MVMRVTWFAPLFMVLALTGSCATAVLAETIPALLAAAKAARDDGNGVLAVRNYHAAAEAGSVEAQALLADIYREGGDGVDKDYAKALFWARKAADQGSTRARVTLGVMYRDGLGVAPDAPKALADFQAASDAGDRKAPRYLGLAFEATGDGAKAFAAYQSGADRGDITSQYLLGRAYEFGIGVEQSYVLARTWYQKSAARGDEIASDGMVGLASLYERGLGVQRDLPKALVMYRQAAATGNETARAAMTRLSCRTASNPCKNGPE